MDSTETDPRQRHRLTTPYPHSPASPDGIEPLPLAEARSVVFLKRPMGELFDEGRLTRDQLLFALTRGYTERLRRAAKTFLTLLDQNTAPATVTGGSAPHVATVAVPVAKPVPMTLARARAVVWPFREQRGKTLGYLLEHHLLTLKDLAYACEQAHDPLLRAAAHTCLQHRLDARIAEPPAPAGPLQVFTSARRHTERQFRQLTLLQGMLYGAVVIACVLLLVAGLLEGTRQFNPTAVARTLGSSPWPVSVVSIVIVLGVFVGVIAAGRVILGRGLEWLDQQLEDRIQAVRAGQRGEDRTADVLRQILDGTWALYRCVELPGQKGGDIDAVLVGPAGVWALEIKTYSGAYRNVGDTWQARSRRGWHPLPKSPSLQAKRNAVRLANHLQSKGLSLFVHPTVVWANPTGSITLDSPSVPVWTLEEIGHGLASARPSAPYPGDTVRQICAELQHLIDRAGVSEADG